MGFTNHERFTRRRRKASANLTFILKQLNSFHQVFVLLYYCKVTGQFHTDSRFNTRAGRHRVIKWTQSVFSRSFWFADTDWFVAWWHFLCCMLNTGTFYCSIALYHIQENWQKSTWNRQHRSYLHITDSFKKEKSGSLSWTLCFGILVCKGSWTLCIYLVHMSKVFWMLRTKY